MTSIIRVKALTKTAASFCAQAGLLVGSIF